MGFWPIRARAGSYPYYKWKSNRQNRKQNADDTFDKRSSVGVVSGSRIITELHLLWLIGTNFRRRKRSFDPDFNVIMKFLIHYVHVTKCLPDTKYKQSYFLSCLNHMQRYVNCIMHLYCAWMSENHNYPQAYRVTPTTHSAYMTPGIEPEPHWWLGNWHHSMVF